MIAAALKGLNLKIAGWSIRSFDTKNENAELVLKRIVKKLKGGDIVLLHDTSANIVPLLESLLQYLKKKGYRCVNLDTLVS
jgi:peptidoglycan/xylan/chitin deacetylase (PgdA/CDA1 family)